MEPSLNHWTIIFLLASMQGIFLSLMLFIRKSKINSLLGFLILGFSLCLLFYVAYWTGYYSLLPWEVGVIQGITFTFGPITYFYIKSDRKKLFFDVYHFIPFILYTSYYLMDAPPRFLWIPILAIAQVLHLIVYSVLIFKWLAKNVGFSNGALKRYKWQRKVTWAFTGYAISFALYYLLVWTGLIKIEYDYIISLASSFFIYFIGYHGFQNQEVLKMNENNKYGHSPLSQKAGHSISSKLRELMNSEKIYLQSTLKLQDLADKMQLNAHLISQVINDVEEKHFSDYVNSFRIEDAKKLLRKSDNKIIHIAYDAGFNNKASFNSAFKKHTGMSPSDYRNSTIS